MALISNTRLPSCLYHAPLPIHLSLAPVSGFVPYQSHFRKAKKKVTKGEKSLPLDAEFASHVAIRSVCSTLLVFSPQSSIFFLSSLCLICLWPLLPRRPFCPPRLSTLDTLPTPCDLVLLRLHPKKKIPPAIPLPSRPIISFTSTITTSSSTLDHSRRCIFLQTILPDSFLLPSVYGLRSTVDISPRLNSLTLRLFTPGSSRPRCDTIHINLTTNIHQLTTRPPVPCWWWHSSSTNNPSAIPPTLSHLPTATFSLL